ncbi:GH32 C-terminal domain-containing protein [Alteribacillus sp. HJP-4]|uniref:GH32 C-terminal domain-containing protein n=1 Tax=Alteribacillus sp. HJP-4 TaxID=2775394 RepID=UPI0035CD2951
MRWYNKALAALMVAGFAAVTAVEVEASEKDDVMNQAEGTEKYYTEMYRPQYHFSTPEGRLADPNGLVYFDGEYHLFHQKMGTWAHAVSKDLLHWEHLPIALEHDELGQALSGTVVIDWNDTTNLFDGEAGMVAIYTSTHEGESQSIAYSKDNGRTWERYDGNPVLENPGIKDFRDPKVFWHEESERWVMAVSTDKSVTFYNSSNLLDWEYQSRFGDGQGSHAAVWECPDLFQLPVDGDEDNQKWVLHVSVGDNEETDGSTAQYFVGDFDGSEFTNLNPADEVLITDYGQDFYAAQSFNELAESEDGRRVWMGWMANWRYPYQSPTKPWMGSMSIPRELSLRTTESEDVRLHQEPVKEIESIRATEHSVDSFTVEGDYLLEDVAGMSYEFETEIEWEEANEFGIRLRQSDEEETVVGLNTEQNSVFLDRTNAGLDTLIDRNGEPYSFGKRFEKEYPEDKEKIKIRGLVDESSVEIFIDDGEFTFTNLIYTDPTNNGIEFFSEGGEIEVTSFDFYHLHSTWRDAPSEGELERIVVNEEEVDLEVGETFDLTANAKPDWFNVENIDFDWESANEEVVKIKKQKNQTASVQGVSEGITNVIVRDAKGDVYKNITIRVLEDKDDGYIYGWGPASLTNTHSGDWNIEGESTVTSQIDYSPDWQQLFKEGSIHGDFTVSADIEWKNQGSEGFPKYGLTMVDENGTMVSGFFNKDIHHIETFARKEEDLGWEGAELPEEVDLTESQTLKVEKTGDTFSYYVNDELLYERTVEVADEMNVGLINENTEAQFTNIIVQAHDEKHGTIESLYQQMKDYISAGDVASPLSGQLLQRVKQVEKHLEQGQIKQSLHHMDKLIKRLDSPGMQKHITNEAKEEIQTEAMRVKKNISE